MRQKALQDLTQYVLQGAAKNNDERTLLNFQRRMGKELKDMAVGIEKTLNDLRSELIKDACACVEVCAKHLKNVGFGKTANSLFDTLLEQGASSNKVIRGYTVKATNVLLSSISTTFILNSLIDKFNESKKSKAAQIMCMTYLNTILREWTERRLDSARLVSW